MYKNSNKQVSPVEQLGDWIGLVAPQFEKMVSIVKKLETQAKEDWWTTEDSLTLNNTSPLAMLISYPT